MRRTGLVMLGLLVALVMMPTRLMAQTLDDLWRSGNAAQSSGKYENAERVWRQIIQRQSSNAAAYNSLGLSLYKQNRLGEAKIAYDQAIRLNSRYSDAYKGRGDVLYLQRKLSEALLDYDQAILLDKKYADAYIGRGNTLKDQGKFEKDQKKFEKAITDYQEVIRLYEELKLIRTYNQEGEVTYQEASQLTSNSKYHLALAYNGLGESQYLQGNLEGAISDYRSAIKLHPKYAEAYNNLGLALYQKDDLLGSINAYENSIKSNPRFIYAYNNLALTLYQQSHRETEEQQREDLIKKAINNYQEALKLPDNTSEKPTAHTWTHNGLGWVYQQQQNLEDAQKQYEAALKIDPKFGYAKNNLKEVQRLLDLRKKPTELIALNEIKYLPDDDLLTPIKRSIVKINIQFPGSNKGGDFATGYVIKRQGNQVWIITNRHVVIDEYTAQTGTNLEIEPYYGEKLPYIPHARCTAKIVKVSNNDNLDLALLETTQLPNDIQPLTLAANPLPPNSPVTIIGHPGESGWLEYKATFMSIKPSSGNLLIDVNLGSGASGSPILDPNRKVIGIMVRTVNESNTDSEAIAIGHPINLVLQQIAQWGIQIP